MISDRAKALLEASATIAGGIVASPRYVAGQNPRLDEAVVDIAYALLAEIEKREGKCEKCGAWHTTPCPDRRPHLQLLTKHLAD